MRRLMPLVGLLALLAACGQYSMANQEKYKPYRRRQDVSGRQRHAGAGPGHRLARRARQNAPCSTTGRR